MSVKDQRVFEPPVITSVSDIKRVLSILDPKHNVTNKVAKLVTGMSGTGHDGGAQFEVSVDTLTSTYRDMIVSGLGILKNRIDAANDVRDKAMPTVVGGREMTPPPAITTDSTLSVDPIISRLLGARRDGLLICWDLTDGYTYSYDVFEHRLTRTEREIESGTSNI